MWYIKEGILVFLRNIGCGGERGVERVLSAGGYRKPTTVSVEVPGASPSLVYSNHVQILTNIIILSRRDGDVTQLSPSLRQLSTEQLALPATARISHKIGIKVVSHNVVE